MRWLALMLFITVSFSLQCETGELNVSVSPHKTDGSVMVSYSSVYNSTVYFYRVPLNLGEGYDFDLNDRTLIYKANGFNGSFHVDLPPGVYKLYAYVSCDWEECNRQYNRGYYCCPCSFDNRIVVYSHGDDESYMSVSVYNVPKEVLSGEEFLFYVNLTSHGISGPVSVYSYVYNGTNCLSDNWTHNRVIVNIQPDSSIVIPLKEKAKGDGMYKLKVRVYAGGRKWDTVLPMYLKPLSNLSIEGDYNNVLTIKIRNRGTQIENVTVMMVSNDVSYFNVTVPPNRVLIKTFNPSTRSVYFFVFKNNTLVDRLFLFRNITAVYSPVNLTGYAVVPEKRVSPLIPLLSLVAFVYLLYKA